MPQLYVFIKADKENLPVGEEYQWIVALKDGEPCVFIYMKKKWYWNESLIPVHESDWQHIEFLTPYNPDTPQLLETYTDFGKLVAENKRLREVMKKLLWKIQTESHVSRTECVVIIENALDNSNQKTIYMDKQLLKLELMREAVKIHLTNLANKVDSNVIEIFKTLSEAVAD